LEVLNKKNVRGVVTTHYSNLKVFASNTEGIENASMLFDNVAMRPLYRLQVGKPGSSYAFEIAEKIGLNAAILQAAKQKVGAQQKRVDTLLVNLERDKKEVYDAKQAIAQQERKLAQLKAENQQLQAYLENNKRTILNKAKEEAREIVRNANKIVENTIFEIKASQADKQKTKALRQQLKEELNKHTDRPTSSSPPATKQTSASVVSFQVGDWVKIPATGNEAEVIGISKNNVVLAMG